MLILIVKASIKQRAPTALRLKSLRIGRLSHNFAHYGYLRQNHQLYIFFLRAGIRNAAYYGIPAFCRLAEKKVFYIKIPYFDSGDNRAWVVFLESGRHRSVRISFVLCADSLCNIRML